MGQVLDEDPWLGTVEHFPTVLHARASLVYDVNTDTLQRALFQSLLHLSESIRTMELTLSDYQGYLDGTVGFRVGVGNRDGFDILDSRVEERVLRRIAAQGVFKILDLSLDLHYKVRPKSRHRVQRDRYLTRMSFQTGRLELLVHHLKGLRRVAPPELIQLLCSDLNVKLGEKGYGGIKVEVLESN